MKNSKIQRIGFIVGFLSTALIAGESTLVPAGKVSNKLESAQKKIEASFDKEEVKRKFHEATDALTEEKICETVDEVADYFDPEYLKENVDRIAQYLDKEKVVQTAMMVIQYLDRDKIKDWIDFTAGYFDREKVKDILVKMLQHLDKEKIKNTFDRGVEQVADSLDRTVDYIRKQVIESEIDVATLQGDINSYDWKKLIADRVSSDAITLSHLKLNGKRKVVIAKPGEEIKGEVVCSTDRNHLSSLSKYHVILGIKDHGMPKPIYNHLGLSASRERNAFTLIAPKERGVYRVGFQVVKTPLESTALKKWEERYAETPTVGLIIVH
jgi:predicted transcriptional regulator